MASLVIGDPIETYDLYVRRKSVHGFVIHWYSDDAHTIPRTDIDGQTFRVLVGPDPDNPIKTWTAVAESNVTTFALSEDDSDLEFSRYDGLIVYQGQTTLVDLRVIVEPA